jgi:hypothetical protein
METDSPGPTRYWEKASPRAVAETRGQLRAKTSLFPFGIFKE